PAPASPLIGRGAELAAIADLLLDRARLVTITGSGGSGKTRLALELAHALTERFEQVAFVPLAPIGSSDLVLSTIARALEIVELPAEPLADTLARTIGERRLLLVLDNFEHLLDGAVDVGRLLKHCSQLRVLVASRATSHLVGEHEYPLDPLPAPDAAALF